MTNSDYGSVRNQVNLFKEKINEVVNQQDEIDEKHPENVLRVEVPWGEEKFNLEKFKIYSIPLSLLTYNKYNGRILSRTKISQCIYI